MGKPDIDAQVIERMKHLTLAQALPPHRPIPPLNRHDFMTTEQIRHTELEREAVRRVFAKYEPSMIPSDEMVDELIDAAQAGW